jgi:hypothetical protein
LKSGHAGRFAIIRCDDGLAGPRKQESLIVHGTSGARTYRRSQWAW